MSETADRYLVSCTARFVWLAILGTALTTLAASLAIAPFAAYHFHRLAHYSLLAISLPCR
jgi:predicted membrane metal-binding protein